jgi:hypothetical protein
VAQLNLSDPTRFKPHKVTYEGTDYLFPPEAPLTLQLSAQDVLAELQGAKTENDVARYIGSVIGEEQVAGMRSAGIGIERLSYLMMWVLHKWGKASDPDAIGAFDEDGRLRAPKAPARATRRAKPKAPPTTGKTRPKTPTPSRSRGATSGSTGATSKRTSKGSTA